VADRRKELDKLRKSAQSRAKDETEALERRGRELRQIRQQAAHANNCNNRVRYIIDDTGVYSSIDGKPITEPHQTLAEEFFWLFVDACDNPRSLLYDEETEAFYRPDPPYELVFSRERCNLACYWWALGDERAWPWGQFGPERLDPERARELEPWP
jgi:hypothetical protein